MTMTSKELVKRAVHFKKPDRLPFTGSMGETDFTGDTVAIFPEFGQKWWLGGGGTDEWGSLWEIEPGSKDMGQVKNIVLENLENYMSIEVPNALDPKRYSGWGKILDRAEKEEKYVVCCNGPFLFERAHFVHGFENTLMDIMAAPDLMRAFLKRLGKYHLDTVAYINANFAGRIHGYRGTDDWGTQQSALISPESFRDVFQPCYREIFKSVHAAGMDAWMHSCGQIYEIIPLLIEVGLDVINLMQPNVFPIERLSAYRDKICFEMCADAQNTLPEGNRKALAEEIRKLLDTCCADDGGFIEVKLDRMYFEGDNVSME
ncbi:MAG: uroporphyrinogen decarboxylase family protein, partial [Lentisphaerota bacterium]